MNGKRYRKVLLNFLVAASSLCLSSSIVRGQEVRGLLPSSAPAPETATAAEVHSLATMIQDLQAQVQSLNSQLADLRSEQQQTSEEAQALRHELDVAKGQLAPVAIASSGQYGQYSTPSAPAAAQQSPTISTVPAPQGTTLEDRVSRLEENQDITDAKVNDQYQTKVESGSKYRLRLSGIVLLNLYDNRGAVDNQDFPQVAESSKEDPFSASPSSFGGSLRQSQIKIQAFGPDLAGARTSADVTFDFAGGFPDNWNGVATGFMRLRTGTIRFDWANTSIIAGQDSLFFAPLAPTSIATLANPPLSYSGNLWSWTPQLRVEHHFQLSDVSNVVLQAGILDSLTGDYPTEEFNRDPSWGEESGQPAYATRISWNHRMFGQNFTVGAGGYYGRQDWGLGRNVDGWAGTTDVTLPLGKLFEFTGEFYRGRAVAGLGGGIGQSVLLNGSFVSPATRFMGLDSMGGWAQLKYKLRPNFEINAALGLDNPFASEMRRYNVNSIYSDTYTRNLTPFINFIYQVRSDILFSTEYSHLQTSALDAGSNSATHISLSLGYLF